NSERGMPCDRQTWAASKAASFAFRIAGGGKAVGAAGRGKRLGCVTGRPAGTEVCRRLVGGRRAGISYRVWKAARSGVGGRFPAVRQAGPPEVASRLGTEGWRLADALGAERRIGCSDGRMGWA